MVFCQSPIAIGEGNSALLARLKNPTLRANGRPPAGRHRRERIWESPTGGRLLWHRAV